MDNYEKTLHALVIELRKIEEAGGRHVSSIYSYYDDISKNVVVEVDSLIKFIGSNLDEEEEDEK